MSRDPHSFDIPPAPQPAASVAADHGGLGSPSLQGWAVAAGDRLVGGIHGRPGDSNGKTIMTSPVVEVRLMGPRRTPVAFTQSGSAYWLGDPAESFGIDRAEQFVWAKSRADAPKAKAEVGMETVVLRLKD